MNFSFTTLLEVQQLFNSLSMSSLLVVMGKTGPEKDTTGFHIFVGKTIRTSEYVHHMKVQFNYVSSESEEAVNFDLEKYFLGRNRLNIYNQL